MLKHLLPRVASIPHVCYVEAFAGGLALLLAKERSQVEIVNDFNGDLVSLYRCAQFHLEALEKEVAMTLFSRRNVVDFQRERGLTELQRAARFLLLNRMSFGGGMKSYAVVRGGGGSKNKTLADVPRMLRDLQQRLDRVSVENCPYERILEVYDAKDTLFFLDPPYLNSKPGSAYDGWEEADLRAFGERVRSLAGNWIVTLDDSQLNREVFKGCRIDAVESSNCSVNRRLLPNAVFKEIIVQPF